MIRAAPLLACAALAVAAPGAAAAPGMELGLEDERIMLDQPDRAPALVATSASLGVAVVRLHARWQSIAPGRYARRRPAGRPDWAALDRAVALVRPRACGSS